MRLIPLLFALTILLFVFASGGFCTEEYAQKTGKECSACHIDPAGGGELTATGKASGAGEGKGGGVLVSDDFPDYVAKGAQRLGFHLIPPAQEAGGHMGGIGHEFH